MTLIIGGLVIAIAAIFALGTPVVLIMDWLQAGLGFLLFISPWVLRFSDELAAAFTAWIVGIITVIVSALITLKVQKAVNREASTSKPNYDTL